MNYKPVLYSCFILSIGLYISALLHHPNNLNYLAIGCTYSVFIASICYDIFKGRQVTKKTSKLNSYDLSNSDHKKILNAVGGGVLTLDGKGIITNCNIAGAFMLGCIPENIIGKAFYEIVGHISEKGEIVGWHNSPICSSILKKEAVYLENETLLRLNVSPMIVSITIIPIENSDSDDTKVAITFTDTTIRNNLEQELKKINLELENRVLEKTADILHAKEIAENAWLEAQKLREQAEEASKVKSEFLANISHELRTPLHSIMAFSELLEVKAETATPDRLTKYSKSINASAGHLLTLVNDLLDTATIEKGGFNYDFIDISIRKIIDQTIEQLSPILKKKNMDVCIEYNNDNRDMLKCDPNRISQVIWNLLSNSIKYSKKDSIVMISVNNFEVFNSPGISISIIDQGDGIPKGEEEKIFERFFRSYYVDDGIKSTGLGLAITKEIVEHHGGYISAKNNVNGRGSTFSFSLPLIPPQVVTNSKKAVA